MYDQHWGPCFFNVLFNVLCIDLLHCCCCQSCPSQSGFNSVFFIVNHVTFIQRTAVAAPGQSVQHCKQMPKRQHSLYCRRCHHLVLKTTDSKPYTKQSESISWRTDRVFFNRLKNCGHSIQHAYLFQLGPLYSHVCAWVKYCCLGPRDFETHGIEIVLWWHL